MKRNKRLLLIFCTAVAALVTSCSKKTTDTGTVNKENITAIGNLEQQGITTYQYGTHVLKMNDTVAYVLKSGTLDLDKYKGMHVQITAKNTHYHVEQGPDLYDVTAIQRMP